VREITGYDSSIERARALFFGVCPRPSSRLRVFDRSNDRANAHERWDEWKNKKKVVVRSDARNETVVMHAFNSFIHSCH